VNTGRLVQACTQETHKTRVTCDIDFQYLLEVVEVKKSCQNFIKISAAFYELSCWYENTKNLTIMLLANISYYRRYCGQ